MTINGDGLNRVGGHSPYRQIADRLRSAILRGELAGGTRLPTERDLAEQYGVLRETVRRAFALLRSEGWLETRQGSGTYVRDQAPAEGIELLLGVDSDERGVFLYRHAEGWDLLAPTRIAWEVPPLDVTRRLGVEAAEPVLVRDRVIGPPGGPPRQLATTYLPEWLVTRLPRLADPVTGPKGFLDLIESAGIELAFTVTFASRMPLPDEQRAFQLGPGSPVLRLIRTSYDGNDRPVEITDYRLSASRFEFTVPLADQRRPAPPPVEQDLAD